MIAPSTVVPWREEERIRRSAVGSPSFVSFSRVISAPMALHTRRIPSRVGLVPTFLRRISLFGTRSPAAIKYAAEEISPGTRISLPYREGSGLTEAVVPSEVTSAPK